jgi:hypothetical protein
MGSSEYLCSAGGKFWNHSTDEESWFENNTFRWEIILSHKINKKNKIPKKEIEDPIEETIFHEV